MFILLRKEILFLIILMVAIATLSNKPPSKQLPPPAGFGITVTWKKSSEGGTIVVSGKKFSPKHVVSFSYSNIPNVQKPVEGGSEIIDSNGTFTYSESWRCLSDLPDDSSIMVSVYAKDIITGFIAEENIPANIWICY